MGKAIGIGIACVICAGAAMAQTTPSLEHPKVPNAAALGGDRAESVYQAIRGQLSASYGKSGDPITAAYQGWRRYNRVPYRSPNHGERFVNHYGNAAAADYGKFEKLDPLPVGTVVIKDSFVVTRNGDLMIGPLFMMEKMQAGFASLAGTWRFMMLRPDGTPMGVTGGEGDANVRFCAKCHRDAGAKRDYLFFMPKEARIPGE